jgi:hypothetical protein
MNLWLYSIDLNISSCFKISDFQVIISEISETGLGYLLARTGVGGLVPVCCCWPARPCCCCTCRRSLIHVLDLLGVYYPTAGSSSCNPQAGSRRPDPISRQSGRPATEAGAIFTSKFVLRDRRNLFGRQQHPKFLRNKQTSSVSSGTK